MKKNSEMTTMSNKVAIESSQQVATTTMFDSGSCASHNMLTGSASCIYVGSKSADAANYKGVCSSGVGYDEGACICSNNNIIGDVAAKMKMGVKSAYHEIMEAPALVHLRIPFHVIAGAGAEYAPPATHEIGYSAAPDVQLQAEATDDHDHHRSQHDMKLRAALQLQGQSAAPLQLEAKELAGPELPQPAAGTDHPRPYYDMSIKMRVQQRPDHIVDSPDHSLLRDSSDHIRASLVVTQGEVDQCTEREVVWGQRLQYMKNYMSPEGSSIMEQDGVYYGGGGDEYEYMSRPRQGQMNMKKRRLTKEQVKSLEVSFERESKLEAERKKELAQELELQPRQVAVWFQNRRARFKTKQLERDFDLLKHQYDAVRSEKDKLLAQVAKLKDLVNAHTHTAATVSCKGKSLLTPPNHTDDEDKHSLSPEKQKATTEGTRKQKASTSCSRGEHKATLQQHIIAAGSEKTHASILASKSLAKGSFTLDVKPSLQVPHIIDHNYYYHRQQQFPLPATNLSLCSPQQLFLHHMVAMKMEGEREPHHSNLYNEEDQDGSESMLCFNSTSWHHDPN